MRVNYKCKNQLITKRKNTKGLVFQLIFIFFSNFLIAQNPTIEWQKSFGGSSGEQAECIKQTSDGGYIVAGYTLSTNGDVIGSHGGFDYWIIKLSSIGILEWKKTFGGTNSEYARSINQTSDGGYIVAGISNSNDGDVSGGHGDNDYWILKLSSIGDIEWQKTLGGLYNDVANIAIQTSDGGYLVGGFTGSIAQDVTDNHGGYDYWIVKLSELGTIQWQKTFGGTTHDHVLNMKQTTDGGYIIAGYTLSNNGDVTGNHGGYDIWIVKISNNGILEWQKTLGGTAQDYAFDIQQTAEGGYIVGGYTNSNNGDVTGNHGGLDYWIVKLSNSGLIEWQKTLGGTLDDYGQSIQQTSENGYIFGGYSKSTNGDVTGNHGNDDYWIVKLSANGIIEWQKTLGGTSTDQCRSIQQTNDNGYILAGLSYSSNGDITLNQGQSDYWIIKLSPSTLSTINFENTNLKIYPNPANNLLNFETNESILNVKITDLNGRLLINKNGLENKELDISYLTKGVYLIQVNTFNNEIIKKFIKE